MKSKVIFYSAIALCAQFVASLPYSVDLQRYSGLNTKPALESSYQPIAPRPYRNWNQRFRTPTVQNQEQQLPRVNEPNVFSRNQQRYLPKGPPPQQQPERYINQKNTANEYWAHHKIYENRPVEVRNNYNVPEQTPSQIINTEPFIPVIPAIPPVPSSNEALRWVGDHFLQVKPPQIEQVLPIIQPISFQEENKRVPKLNDFDRYMAKASDPVEQIPEPRRALRPELERFLEHPRIKNILATTKQQKRYLVIHPDGTVEHVDKLHSVAEKHPNYFLVHAGDIVAHRNRGVVTPPRSQLPMPPSRLIQPIDFFLNNREPSSVKPVLEAPIPKSATVETNIPEDTPKPVEAYVDKPSTVEVEAVVQEPSTNSPVVAVAEVASTTAIPDIVITPSTQHPEIDVQKQVLTPINLRETKSVSQLDAVAIAVTVTPPNSLTPDPVHEITSEKVSISTEKSSAEPNNPSTKSSLPKDPIVDVVSAAFLPHIQVPKPVEISEKPQETTARPSEAPVITIAEIHIDDKPPTEPLENKTPDDAAVIISVNPDSVQEVPRKIDEYIVEAASEPSPVEILNFGADPIDISKASLNPPVWFRTSEPNFMEKLTDKNNSLDVVYFFQIHNQPKIEKDVKTTIHPNGTIVEDVVTKMWDFEGDEPRISKTTKIIHPDDL